MTQGGKTSIWQDGFTIAEVMIVLAVTGFLFFTAFVYINGRQNRTEFQVGIRQIQQEFQQVINEVASGYYPNSSGFTCDATATPVKLTDSGATPTQGTNKDCIFVGKVFTVGASRKNNVGVFSLAGSRLNSSKQDVTTPMEAKPAAIAVTSLNSAAPTDITQEFTLPNSIQFDHASIVKPDGTTVNAWPSGAPGGLGIAITSSLANFANAAVSSAQSATQTLQMYYLHAPAWTTATDPVKEADAINAEVTAAMPDNWAYRLRQVQYCFASGTTNQSGLVTVGNEGGGLTVKLDIKNGKSC